MDANRPAPAPAAAYPARPARTPATTAPIATGSTPARAAAAARRAGYAADIAVRMPDGTDIEYRGIAAADLDAAAAATDAR